jgi:hypothetical protein
MNYDLSGVTSALSKALEAQSNSQKSKTDFQNQVLLAKVKQQWETKAKEQESNLALEQEKQKKQILNPYEQMMMDEYKAQKDGGVSGGIGQDTRPTEFVPGAKGITQKKVGLRDMAERVYMKPEEQWTDNDKQIVARYQAMKSSIGGQTNVRNSIMSKVQRGEKLSPGELQLYNDTIKKKGGGGLADMFNDEETQNANPELDDLFKGL